MRKKLSALVSALVAAPLVGAAIAGSVLGAQGSEGLSAGGKTAASAAPQPSAPKPQTEGSDPLVVNGEFPYGNSASDDAPLVEENYPSVTAFNKTTITTSSLANLGQIKQIRIDGFGRRGSSNGQLGVSAGYMSELSIRGPDGTALGYSINPHLSTSVANFPGWTQTSSGGSGWSRTFYQDTLNDGNWSAPGVYAPVNWQQTVTLDVNVPSLIDRIELGGNVDYFGRLVLTDIFNNAWTLLTRSVNGELEGAVFYRSPNDGSAPVKTANQPNRTTGSVEYGSPPSAYLINDTNFAGRKTLGGQPGVQYVFSQQNGLGYDPIVSVPYADGFGGVSLFVRGTQGLEELLANGASLNRTYDGINFSIGHARLTQFTDSFVAYTASPLVDFNQILSSNPADYLRYLLSTGRLIRRTPTAVRATADGFSSAADHLLNVQAPIVSPVSGMIDPNNGNNVSAFVTRDALFPALSEEQRANSGLLNTALRVAYRMEVGTRSPGTSYFPSFGYSDYPVAQERISLPRSSNADDPNYWTWNRGNQFELLMISKPIGNNGTYSIGSFGHSYSIDTYALDGAATALLEPSVSAADLVYGRKITNYGLENLGNISRVTINLGAPIENAYTANFLSTFLSEIGLYGGADGKSKIDYAVTEYAETEAGKNVGPLALPLDDLSVVTSFLKDNDAGYARTFQSLTSGSGARYNGRLVTVTTAGQGSTLRLYSNAARTGDYSNILMFDRATATNLSQKITLRLYEPQPLNHISVYFGSRRLATTSFSVTTADGVTYTPEVADVRSTTGDIFSQYVLEKTQDATSFPAAVSERIDFPSLPAGSTPRVDTAAATATSRQVVNALPLVGGGGEGDGVSWLGTAPLANWIRLKGSFDDSTVEVTGSLADQLGPITGGTVRIPHVFDSVVWGYGNADSVATRAFRSLVFYDENGNLVPWKIVDQTTDTPAGINSSERVFKGNFFRVAGSNANLAAFTPQSDSPYNWAVLPSSVKYNGTYYWTRSAPFEQAANNPNNGYFSSREYALYTGSPQPAMASIDIANWAFVWQDGQAHKIERVEFRGQKSHLNQRRLYLSLFSENGFQYNLNGFRDVSGSAEYWQGDAMVVGGPSNTTWVSVPISSQTPLLSFNDAQSYAITKFTYSRYIGIRKYTGGFRFEAYSTRLQTWLPLESYLFEPDATKPKNNLLVWVRWSRLDGALLANGNRYNDEQLDFSYLRFQAARVSIRSIVADASQLVYTRTNGAGAISGLSITVPQGVTFAYVVTKPDGSVSTSATQPVNLANGDKVSVRFALGGVATFFDPLNPGVEYDKTLTIDLPAVANLPAPTNVDLTKSLAGWVNTDDKIKMAFAGSDYNGQIATSTLNNLRSLQASIKNAQVFLRVGSSPVNIPVGDGVSDNPLLSTLVLANGQTISAYITLLSKDTLSYEQSGPRVEFLLNTYTVLGLGTPQFAQAPNAITLNQGIYAWDQGAGLYRLSSSFVTDPNWDVFVTSTSLLSTSTSVSRSLPATIAGEVNLDIQISPKSGFAFGNAGNYRSQQQLYKYTFYYPTGSTSGPVQTGQVLYTYDLFPLQGYAGIPGLNDVRGVINFRNSPLLLGWIRLGLNFRLYNSQAAGTQPFLSYNGSWSSTSANPTLTNGQYLRIELEPAAGYKWYTLDGSKVTDNVLPRAYIINNLIRPNVATIPFFSVEVSGYDGQNTFARTTGNGTVVADLPFANESAFPNATASLIYLPQGFLPSGSTPFSVFPNWSPVSPLVPGKIPLNTPRANLTNGSVLIYALKLNNNSVFQNGDDKWVKYVFVNNLPELAELPDLPSPTDQQAVIRSNLFSGTRLSNTLGQYLSGELLKYGTTEVTITRANAAGTVTNTWTADDLPIQGPPFVEGDKVTFHFVRERQHYWWNDGVGGLLQSPATLDYVYTVPPFPENLEPVDTTLYPDLATKSTVSFGGVTQNATATIKFSGTIPPQSTNVAEKTGASSIAVKLAVGRGVDANGRLTGVVYSGFAPVTEAAVNDPAHSQLITPNLVFDPQTGVFSPKGAPIANDMYYTVEFVPTYQYGIFDGSTPRPTPWTLTPQPVKISGILTSVFTAANLSQPVSVTFEGISGSTGRLVNLFDPAFVAQFANYGTIEVFTVAANGTATLYDPSTSPPLRNRQQMRLRITPDHAKYVVFPNKIVQNADGTWRGGDDDVYVQDFVVNGLREAVKLSDITALTGGANALRNISTQAGTQRFAVYQEQNYFDALNDTSKLSNGIPLPSAVDYYATLIDANGVAYGSQVTLNSLLYGSYFDLGNSPDQPGFRQYYYRAGSKLQLTAVAATGYAIVDANNVEIPGPAAVKVTDVLAWPLTADTDYFGSQLEQDPTFNTGTDFRLKWRFEQQVPYYVQNAILRGEFALHEADANKIDTQVDFTPNGDNTKNKSFKVVYGTFSNGVFTPGDPLTQTNQTTGELELQLNANGAPRTPIGYIEFFYQGAVPPFAGVYLELNDYLDGTFTTETTGITTYPNRPKVRYGPVIPGPFASLTTTVYNVVAIPAGWQRIPAIDAAQGLYDPNASYEGNVIFDAAKLTDLVNFSPDYVYDLVVTTAAGQVLSTYENVFAGAISTTSKTVALDAAFDNLSTSDQSIGNYVQLVARITDPLKRFDLSSPPATPSGFSYTASRWTLARISLRAPSVKRSYYVPTDIDSRFTNRSVSGLFGSPQLFGLDAFAFAPNGTQVTFSITPAGETSPRFTKTITDPSRLTAEVQAQASLLANGAVLRVSMNPRSTDALVDGTRGYLPNQTPAFAKQITVTDVANPIEFITFAPDNITYRSDDPQNPNAALRAEISDTAWASILGQGYAAGLANLTISATHTRGSSVLHNSDTAFPNGMTAAQFATFLSTTIGANGQNPASAKLALNDRITVRLRAKDGYLFTNLTAQQTYTYTFEERYLVKQQANIVPIVPAYTTVATADTPPRTVNVSGISTLVFPETISSYNNKGLDVEVVVTTARNPVTYTNALPATIANGDVVRVTLKPKNPLATAIRLSGESTSRSQYTVTFNVSGLLQPTAINPPSSVTIVGTLNGQASVNLDWVVPQTRFVITTTIKNNANDANPITTTTPVSELRNGQIVSLEIAPVDGYIISINGRLVSSYSVPAFTVSGLRESATVPTLPDSLLLLTAGTSPDDAITVPLAQSSTTKLEYIVTYADGTTKDFDNLTVKDFTNATRLSIRAIGLNGAVLDADGTVSRVIGSYTLSAAAVNPPLVDLAGVYTDANIVVNGVTYNLPDTPSLPANVTLRFLVDGEVETSFAPRDISVYSSVSITPALLNGTAALFTARSAGFPAKVLGGAIVVPTRTFAQPSYYGFDGDATIVFDPVMVQFARTDGVVTSLVLLREGRVVSLDLPGGATFDEQVAAISSRIRDGDQLQAVFNPADGRVFADSPNAQTLVNSFDVSGLAPAAAAGSNVAAIAISVAAAVVVLLVAVPALLFTRRVIRG